MSYNDGDDVNQQFQDGLNLQGQGQGQDQGDGYGGGDRGDQGNNYGGGNQDSTGYGGGNQDSTGDGVGNQDSTGYGGGNQDSTGYGGGNQDSTGYGGNQDQGYGGGGQDGGQDDGDGNSGKKAHKRHKEEGYGGDQPDQSTGGDQGYGGGGGNTDPYGGGAKTDSYGGGGNTDSYGGDSTNQGQYGVSGGLSSDPTPTRGEAGPTAVQENVSELAAGGTLHVGQTLASAGGAAKLVFQQDGNLVLYKDNRAVWATGTDRSKEKPAILAVQEDQNVALYAAGGAFAGWATNTGGKGGNGALKLVVSDSGVLVLLDGEQSLWSSAPVDASELSQLASGGSSAY